MTAGSGEVMVMPISLTVIRGILTEAVPELKPAEESAGEEGEAEEE